jgi:alkylated DNA repair dioxygenase AlkB
MIDLVMFDYQAQSEFDALRADIEWQQRHIEIYGKRIPEPRLTAWYGDKGAEYTYSGIAWEPKPWSHLLVAIKERVQSITGEKFNSVLLNYYRHGKDSIGFHSDDEPELGEQPVIATLSFGAERTLKFKHKWGKEKDIAVALKDCSLLVMRGQTQKHWKHGIEKVTNADGRISLTFRTIIAAKGRASRS